MQANGGIMQDIESTGEGRARSGKARMEALSPEQRTALATKAAESRWQGERELTQQAERIFHATHTGELPLAGSIIQCAVLEDGTRVISRNAIFRAFGRTKRGRARDENRVPNMPSFADARNIQPFVESYVEGGLTTLVYKDLKGRVKAGYNALVLPQLCDVYLEARKQGLLTKSQQSLAIAAEILARSLSKVGIIALVDEATGYQEVRDRVALQEILNKYIGKELARWVNTFPQEFYKEIFRLKKWTFDPDSSRRPVLMATITIDLVYRRLAPGVLAKLQELSPRDDRGRRKHKLFQWLSDDVGHPALRDHLSNIIFLAKSQDDWESFRYAVDRAAPRFGDTLPLPLSDETPTGLGADHSIEPAPLLPQFSSVSLEKGD